MNIFFGAGILYIYNMFLEYSNGLKSETTNWLYPDVVAGGSYNVYIYNHFHIIPHNYGFSAAASVLLFIVTSALGSICFAMNADPEAKKKKALIKEAKRQAKLQSKSAFGGF